MADILLILFGAAFVNNIVLVKLLGLCPVTGSSGRMDAAYGMALATGFVLTFSAAVSWVLRHWLLLPLGIGYLHTLSLLLVIAVVVQFTETVMARRQPRLFGLLGIYLPLLAGNCAVLGVALLNAQAERSLFAAVTMGFGASLGFALVLVLFSALRERLETADVPAAWRGAPILLVTAGLMSLAFLGFAGMVH